MSITVNIKDGVAQLDLASMNRDELLATRKSVAEREKYLVDILRVYSADQSQFYEAEYKHLLEWSSLTLLLKQIDQAIGKFSRREMTPPVNG